MRNKNYMGMETCDNVSHMLPDLLVLFCFINAKNAVS